MCQEERFKFCSDTRNNIALSLVILKFSNGHIIPLTYDCCKWKATKQQKISKAFCFPEFSISIKIQENFHIPWAPISQCLNFSYLIIPQVAIFIHFPTFFKAPMQTDSKVGIWRIWLFQFFLKKSNLRPSFSKGWSSNHYTTNCSFKMTMQKL